MILASAENKSHSIQHTHLQAEEQNEKDECFEICPNTCSNLSLFASVSGWCQQKTVQTNIVSKWIPPPRSHGLHVLTAVLFLRISPAVTASPYGNGLASSGAAVICGGTPLVIEKLLRLSGADSSHIWLLRKLLGCVQQQLLFVGFSILCHFF